MKKKVVIISIVCSIVAILALTAIVIGAVFRVNKFNVEWVGDRITIETDEGELPLTDKQVFDASGIKKGCSTLFLNKESAKNKIESSYPYIRVLQIRITGARTLEFRLTARHEMFYYSTKNDGYYYILDEELKVLDKVVKTELERVENLVEIKPTFSYLDEKSDEQQLTNLLGTTSNTKPCDFLGNENYRGIFNSLYVAMYKTLLVNEDGSLWLNNTTETNVEELLESNQIRYFERADINKVLQSVEFKTGYTLSNRYLRLVLHTKAGVEVDIAKPETDLEYKINNCFSIVSMLDNDKTDEDQANEKTSSTSGKVVFEFDENDVGKFAYFVDNE